MNNKNHPKQHLIIEACQRLSKPIRFPILSALLHLLRAGTIQRESSEMDLMATYCACHVCTKTKKNNLIGCSKILHKSLCKNKTAGSTCKKNFWTDERQLTKQG